MQTVITDPHGAQAAIERLGVSLSNLQGIISPSDKLDSLERLSIYNRGYHARLIECLKVEFPCLQSALGETLFNQFAFDYLQHYPPQSYTLNELGKHFPSYLEETSPNACADASKQEREHWPDFIVDLATLERTYLEIYDAEGSEEETPMHAEDLLGISSERFIGLKLKIVKALSILKLSCRVDQYFYAYRQGEEPNLPVEQNCALVVYRYQYIVRLLPITIAEEECFLTSLKNSHTVSEALAQSTGLSQSDARISLLHWADQGMFLSL